MARYIDADNLLRNTIYNPRHVPYIAESDIIFAPTADVVEVVRCKDCVNCSHLVYKYDRNEEWWCGGLEVVPDGFCNYGERREDE